MEAKISVITSEPLLQRENRYFSLICPPGGDLSFTMSGRCGIYQCLEDIKLRDRKRVAYLPMYTCETVVAPFHKAGYTIRFYEVDRNLRSIFDWKMIDEISVLSLCGYYGFILYDRAFVEACHNQGVIILEDMTHSALSLGGMDPLCDYAAGSFRKWMEIPSGGFAVKCSGKFEISCQSPDKKHLALRRQYIATHDMKPFWDAEMTLRRMFGLYQGDDESECIMRYSDIGEIIRRRRENYQTLLDALPKSGLRGLSLVFPKLIEGVAPSHFCLYAENREHFLRYLEKQQIPYKVFWPVGPLVDLTGHKEVRYIYEHIVSLFCDQHQKHSDIMYLSEVLSAYPGISNRV